MLLPTITELLIAGALFAVVLVLLYSLVCLYFALLEWHYQRQHEAFRRRELSRLGLVDHSPKVVK